MDLTKVPQHDLESEIARFQAQQKRYSPKTETSKMIGKKLLAPLFVEMARRQKAGELV